MAFHAKARFVQALADEAALFAEPQARRKREICCLSDCTWSSRLLVAAEVSSTKAAFCWVAWSSCMTAWLIWSMPSDCSREATATSAAVALTRSIDVTTSWTAVPAFYASSVPASIFSVFVWMMVLISCAASAERLASERTSAATTAKPLPCSPARAASTAAFSARMLV